MKKGYSLTSFFLLFFMLITVELCGIESEIIKYLDSGDYEMAHESRIDRMFHYIIQAEQLGYNEKDLDPLIKQRIQLNFITIFQKIGQKEHAITHLKKWVALANQTQNKGNLYFINLSRLGTNYMSLNQPDSALKYFKYSVDYANISQKEIYFSSSYNNLGIFYFRNKKFEQANTYYDQAIKALSLKNKVDTLFFISIKDNKANYFLSQGDTLKAINLIEENLEILSRYPKNQKRYIKYAIKLLDLLVSFKNESKALINLKGIDMLIKGNKQEKISFNLRKQVLVRLITFSNAAIRCDLVNRLNLLNDSIINIQAIQQNRLNESIKEYLVRIGEREKQSLIDKSILINRKNRNNQIALVVILIFLILLIGLIFLVYNSRIAVTKTEKKLKEQELKVQFLENSKLSKDLELKKNDFSELHMQMTLQENFNHEIVEQLKLINSERESEVSDGINKLIRELKQKSSLFEKLELQTKGLDEVNSSFFEKLDEKFSDLTKSERDLCGLIRLRLDGKEIAMIRNIQPSSVRKLRYRLRKKLGINHRDDIYDFIANI